MFLSSFSVFQWILTSIVTFLRFFLVCWNVLLWYTPPLGCFRPRSVECKHTVLMQYVSKRNSWPFYDSVVSMYIMYTYIYIYIHTHNCSIRMYYIYIYTKSTIVPLPKNAIHWNCALLRLQRCSEMELGRLGA